MNGAITQGVRLVCRFSLKSFMSLQSAYRETQMIEIVLLKRVIDFFPRANVCFDTFSGILDFESVKTYY
jgi:hypothetical protein